MYSLSSLKMPLDCSTLPWKTLVYFKKEINPAQAGLGLEQSGSGRSVQEGSELKQTVDEARFIHNVFKNNSPLSTLL